MKKTLRIVPAQLNLTVGDITGNLEKHLQAANEARDKLHADVIVFPELSLTGYPAEDLLFRSDFIQAAEQALEKMLQSVSGIYCLVGHPLQTKKGLYNAVSLIHDGAIIAQYAKQCLPNYAVFDEARYFIGGHKNCVVKIHGIPTGILICEDVWRIKPMQNAVAKGAKLILVPNASPFESNKHELRLGILSKRVRQNKVPVVYVNCVGGQDDLIFDGGSMVMNKEGQLEYLAPFFKEALTATEITIDQPDNSKKFTAPSEIERVYNALVLGVRDYVNKNNIPGVLIGLSGGIDSALTLCIAVDALGKDRVKAIGMPSQYTSTISLEEAEKIAKQLQVDYQIISIEPANQAFLTSLATNFYGKQADVTEENLQARCRGVILMALSNKSGYMVLSTSNRSECAVGYSTLYGDMVGGYAVLKDVLKTLVYQLANYRNSISAAIPQRTIDRAPSAELAPNQKDEDSLPPYSILDRILQLYLDEGKSIEDISRMGFDRSTIEKVANLVRISEYKRRQAPIGPRINKRSFGKDWRYPITNKFKN